jgi:hypothetical protein
MFPGLLTSAVLISVPLSPSFDVVLGQDWLSGHHAVLDAKTGRVSIGGEGVTAVPAVQISDSHVVGVHPGPFVSSSGSVHSTPVVQLAPLQGTAAPLLIWTVLLMELQPWMWMCQLLVFC